MRAQQSARTHTRTHARTHGSGWAGGGAAQQVANGMPTDQRPAGVQVGVSVSGRHSSCMARSDSIMEEQGCGGSTCSLQHRGDQGPA